MPSFEFTQRINQLEERRGSYFYLTLPGATINQFEKKRHTRLICEVDDTVSFGCGLNHLGDGNFFIILAEKHFRKLGKGLGEEVQFKIYEDPNPLGVEVPEVLEVFLDQDPEAKAIYEAVTDGKKRSLIYYIKDTKNVDLQVKRILETIEKFRLELLRKRRS